MTEEQSEKFGGEACAGRRISLDAGDVYVWQKMIFNARRRTNAKAKMLYFIMDNNREASERCGRGWVLINGKRAAEAFGE